MINLLEIRIASLFKKNIVNSTFFYEVKSAVLVVNGFPRRIETRTRQCYVVVFCFCLFFRFCGIYSAFGDSSCFVQKKTLLNLPFSTKCMNWSSS
mmetsp:Transcript_60/g.102  ORF Transcript_60/g.102 Transcript_60/m.102 type:complete len:95 (+) Transcript_60:872-1156(+)